MSFPGPHRPLTSAKVEKNHEFNTNMNEIKAEQDECSKLEDSQPELSLEWDFHSYSDFGQYIESEFAPSEFTQNSDIGMKITKF